MSTLSTHVLDSARGRPAADVGVRLESSDGAELATERTDADGRIGDLVPDGLPAGSYRVTVRGPKGTRFRLALTHVAP